MTKRRPDGSIQSNNNPIWENRYQERDTGLYFGIVVETQRPVLNLSATSGKEQSYTVRLLGTDRDGQLLPNCRVIRPLGGRQNFSDVTLKAAEDPTFIDFGSELSIVPLGAEGGDYVYIQFLNGDITLPIIVGMGKHPLDPQEEVPTLPPLGQQMVKQFNGVKTEIDPSGNYTWTKGLGAYSPVGFDLNNPLIPLVNEYVAVPLSEDLFKFAVDGVLQTATFSAGLPEPAPRLTAELNILSDSISFNTATTAGITISGLTDSIDIATLAGANVAISGITDSVAIGTLVGTGATIDGLTDSISLAATAGASISVSGLTDTIEASTTVGNSLSMGPSGVTLQNFVGGKLELPAAGLTLTDVAGAGLEVSPAGFIKLGNAGAELVDIIDQLITSLSTATYPGFGAPGSNVADLIQLAVQIKLIKGG